MNLKRQATTAIGDWNDRNRVTEAIELDWLRTHPDKVFLYVTVRPSDNAWQIGTWLGTVVSSSAVTMGKRTYGGFGSFRRSVSCRLFGVRYHGWYYESSGNYCRLTKCKEPKR